MTSVLAEVIHKAGSICVFLLPACLFTNEEALVHLKTHSFRMISPHCDHVGKDVLPLIDNSEKVADIFKKSNSRKALLVRTETEMMFPGRITTHALFVLP